MRARVAYALPCLLLAVSWCGSSSGGSGPSDAGADASSVDAGDEDCIFCVPFEDSGPPQGDDSSVKSFKDLMNGKPKLVFSRTLKRVEWQNSRLASGTISEEVARLKQTPGDGLICVGGSDLAASLLEEGLLDELWVLVTPVLIGGGKTLMDAIKKRHPLKLLSTRAFKSGNVALTYDAVRR